MQISNQPFQLGRHVELSYPHVGPNSHPGRIVRVTPRSLFNLIDGEANPSRFLQLHGQWRDEFGYAVSIRAAANVVPQEHDRAAM